jgi:hypothetical protein
MKRHKRNESSDLEEQESSLPTNGSQAEGDLDTVEEDLEMQDDDSDSDDDE